MFKEKTHVPPTRFEPSNSWPAQQPPFNDRTKECQVCPLCNVINFAIDWSNVESYYRAILLHSSCKAWASRRRFLGWFSIFVNPFYISWVGVFLLCDFITKVKQIVNFTFKAVTHLKWVVLNSTRFWNYRTFTRTVLLNLAAYLSVSQYQNPKNHAKTRSIVTFSMGTPWDLMGSKKSIFHEWDNAF